MSTRKVLATHGERSSVGWTAVRERGTARTAVVADMPERASRRTPAQRRRVDAASEAMRDAGQRYGTPAGGSTRRLREGREKQLEKLAPEIAVPLGA